MILVTGGAGFIGSHLVHQLVRAGQAVRVLELPEVDVDHLPLDRITVVRGDIRQRQSVRDAVCGCRQVYHLAANPNLWTRDRREFDAVNHQGTVHVLREALCAGAQKVLHTSTESILTSMSFQGGQVEHLPLRAADMVGPYCMSKFRAEQEAMRLAGEGAPVVIVNPTLPVGPGDRGLSPPTRMTVACMRGTLPAYLDCRFNMIDARDVADGMVRAMCSGQPGKRYLVGCRNLRLREWLTMAATAVGRRPPRCRVPYWLALGVAYASEFVADHITQRTPQATVTGVRLTRYCMHFDPAESLHELGLAPRPLEDSLRDAIHWYRQMQWI